MELYAGHKSVELAASQLATRSGSERIEPLTELSWHLRQRDTRRAEILAQQAQALADKASPASQVRARILLVRAECALLLARLDEAQRLASEARALFAQGGDPEGVGDAALVEARIAESRGERPVELERYREALAAYRESGDVERIAHSRAAASLAQGFGDPAAMARELEAIRSEVGPGSPAVRVHLRFIEGVAAFQRGDFLAAVPALDEAGRGAYEWGLCD